MSGHDEKALRMFYERITANGEWDDGCFYYHGTSASELEEPLRLAKAALTTSAIASAGGGEVVAEIVSMHGDPEAFGERELVARADIQRFPYKTKLYATPPAPAATGAGMGEALTRNQIVGRAFVASKKWIDEVWRSRDGSCPGSVREAFIDGYAAALAAPAEERRVAGLKLAQCDDCSSDGQPCSRCLAAALTPAPAEERRAAGGAIAKAVADEREACVSIEFPAPPYKSDSFDSGWWGGIAAYRDAIRARTTKEES